MSDLLISRVLDKSYTPGHVILFPQSLNSRSTIVLFLLKALARDAIPLFLIRLSYKKSNNVVKLHENKACFIIKDVKNIYLRYN